MKGVRAIPSPGSIADGTKAFLKRKKQKYYGTFRKVNCPNLCGQYKNRLYGS